VLCQCQYKLVKKNQKNNPDLPLLIGDVVKEVNEPSYIEHKQPYFNSIKKFLYGNSNQIRPDLLGKLVYC